LIKAIEKERENYNNFGNASGYVPKKFILKGKYPFYASLNLDYPISIFGKGKVCIYSEEEDPVLTINSSNVWINNITLRQRECENVSAVNIGNGYAFIENCTIQSNYFCVSINSQCECDISDSSLYNSYGGIRLKSGAYCEVEKTTISKNKEALVLEEDSFLRMKQCRIVENEIGFVSENPRNTLLVENYFSKNLKMGTSFPITSFNENIIHDEMIRDLKPSIFE
jgi:parallel beta-helix repeat protein